MKKMVLCPQGVRVEPREPDVNFIDYEHGVLIKPSGGVGV